MTTFTDDFGQELFGVHGPEQCHGRRCVIHKPTEHHMREWPLNWRNDRRIFERICPHGIGHPDPDDLQWQIEYHEDVESGVHGCDGCCNPPGESVEPSPDVAA